MLHNIISVLFNLKFDKLNDTNGILEYLVSMREEKLETANPNVNDDKQRLVKLLKEAGRVQNKKTSNWQGRRRIKLELASVKPQPRYGFEYTLDGNFFFNQ